MKRLIRATFVCSIFLSAFLLFLIEPMVARALLPIYGGSPAVWNTCLVCFQLLLLIGYAWAHWSVEVVGIKRQLVVQGLLLLASTLFIPFTIPAFVPRLDSPVTAILIALLGSIGISFFLLSSNSSLVQRWYSLQPLEDSADPFWLYATSNAGSLLALLGYPLLFEGFVGLRLEWRLWGWGYIVFLLFSAACIYLSWRSADSGRFRGDGAGAGTTAGGVLWGLRAGWVLRAAVASSLLLSVTLEITTDIGSTPLFWVVPLAIYLLSFILAFGRSWHIPRPVIAVAAAMGIAICMAGFAMPALFPIWLILISSLATLFFGSLLCHGDIADSRPAARELTDFYLWVSFGGMLGGVLNTLVAPVVFDSVAEYPITLFLLAVLLHSPRGLALFEKERLGRIGTYLPGLTMLAAMALSAAMVLRERRGGDDAAGWVSPWELMPFVVLLFGLLFARHRGQFAVAVGLVAVYALAGFQTLASTVEQSRGFFGVLRVLESHSQRTMTHGTTIHGSQRREPELEDVPLRYYYPTGPMGSEVKRMAKGANIGVVGLGVGSLAILGRPGQRMTFFEIDRDVERLARRYFSYIRRSPAMIRVKIGDGRLLLREEPDRSFDLLVLDAFSSDAVPTHLLTEEAIALYLRKVQPDGLVLIHVSNRHLDLVRPFRGLQRVRGIRSAVCRFNPLRAEAKIGASPAIVVALSPDLSVLENMVKERRCWEWLEPEGPSVFWTDDRVDLVGAFRLVRR